ncbi:MAG: Tat pathway signal sequence domain protein [Pseudomonadota bacterium]
MKKILGTLGILVLSLVLAAPFQLTAAQADKIALEVNKVEQRESGCLFYLVVANNQPTDFQVLKLDLVLFDLDDIIIRRIVANLAPLPENKTSVKLFEIPNAQCSQVGKILINEALECSSTNGEEANCLSAISPSSKTGIELFF